MEFNQYNTSWFVIKYKARTCLEDKNSELFISLVALLYTFALKFCQAFETGLMQSQKFNITPAQMTGFSFSYLA